MDRRVTPSLDPPPRIDPADHETPQQFAQARKSSPPLDLTTAAALPKAPLQLNLRPNIEKRQNIIYFYGASSGTCPELCCDAAQRPAFRCIPHAERDSSFKKSTLYIDPVSRTRAQKDLVVKSSFIP